MSRLALLLSASLFAAAPVAASEPELLVFAAASLADALTEVGEAFEAQGGGELAFNFAASNDLARQILAGAPADLFVSANEEQVVRLEEAGRAPAGKAFALLGNTLVVVVPAASEARDLAAGEDLLGFERLALADPEAVPAGVYARTWLTAQGLWARLERRIVPTLDVRAALAAVAAGNVPAGIVYRTDAASTDRVRVVFEVPREEAPEVRYFVAPVAAERAHPVLPAFLAYLRGEAAAAVFRRHGFAVLGQTSP